MFRSSHRLCETCSYRLLSIFTNDIPHAANLSRHGAKSFLQTYPKRTSPPSARAFTTQKSLKASVENNSAHIDDQTGNPAQRVAIVRRARQVFGETLPENFLSQEEYLIYERLYGPPSATTLPEDIDMLMGAKGDEMNATEDADTGAAVPSNVLYREDKDGNLEEVIYEDDVENDSEYVEEVANEAEDVIEHEVRHEDLEEIQILEAEEGSEEAEETSPGDQEMKDEFQARVDILREHYAVERKYELSQKTKARRETQVDEENREEALEAEFEEEILDEEIEYEIEDEIDEYDTGITARAHPLTKAGRFGTSPSTIQLPKDSLVNPTITLFADVSNKQLREITQQTFGGKGLPTSTATFRRPNLKQQTIPLEASHGRMGEMEANAFLAAIYPGAYASTMSTLVEVRKRLGSDWLRNLMAQPDGPRILDAGSGGAAVLAWREVIKAEYESMHPDLTPESDPPPFGKSTVVTGSHTLRSRASALLEDTTFIPRLPDYNPSRDHPSLESTNPQPRKQYDIIIAPYTLWSLKEDHQRKSQIQNFWSLLHPRGGVLILIEKGVPRGLRAHRRRT